MQILKHPTFKDTHVSVPDDAVDRWVAAGWRRLVEPKVEPESDTDGIEVIKSWGGESVSRVRKQHDEA